MRSVLKRLATGSLPITWCSSSHRNLDESRYGRRSIYPNSDRYGRQVPGRYSTCPPCHDGISITPVPSSSLRAKAFSIHLSCSQDSSIVSEFKILETEQCDVLIGLYSMPIPFSKLRIRPKQPEESLHLVAGEVNPRSTPFTTPMGR